MKRLVAIALLALAAACGGDDDGGSAPDAAPCILPATTISCTVGDDTPCTAECAAAYCYQFGANPPLCTSNCTGPADCPTGWSCNGMGRCRNP
jgi:hypothetical protein